MKEIIINTSIAETRVALLEDGKLVELFVERPEKERMVGDIYKGRVENVIKGMGACFVDIGHEQNAFLRFSDTGEFLEAYGSINSSDEGDQGFLKTLERERRERGVPVVSGQEILVQITKEPISTKGARVTSEITLPGRFLVLVPGYEHVGVSRKIDDVRERRRLRSIARHLRPQGFGLIVRTAAMKKDQETLSADLQSLLKTWEKIERKARKEKAPALIYKDMGMVSSVIRDLFTPDVDRVVVDSRKLYREITAYLKDVSPHLVPRVELYKGARPIFDVYNLEEEIEKSLSRRVWLRSGAYIVIEHTEALVAIDVNSGKYVSRGDQEESALRINLEAAHEIARQLRLRDIGGIIVIDFIDMRNERNRMRVFNELRNALRRDRARATISPISSLGLVEMTRERVRPELLFAFTEPCPLCEGTGYVVSKATVVTKIEQWIRRFKSLSRERRLKLQVHPELAKHLRKGAWSYARRLMWKYLIMLEIEPDSTLAFDKFRFFSKKTGEDITEKYMQ